MKGHDNWVSEKPTEISYFNSPLHSWDIENLAEGAETVP